MFSDSGHTRSHSRRFWMEAGIHGADSKDNGSSQLRTWTGGCRHLGVPPLEEQKDKEISAGRAVGEKVAGSGAPTHPCQFPGAEINIGSRRYSKDIRCMVRMLAWTRRASDRTMWASTTFRIAGPTEADRHFRIFPVAAASGMIRSQHIHAKAPGTW